LFCLVVALCTVCGCIVKAQAVTCVLSAIIDDRPARLYLLH
jgi:hypothetical protein